MRSEVLTSGVIVRYPYLWKWQRDDGEDIGDKDRPVCIVTVIYDERQDIHHLVILAISSTEIGRAHV